MSQDSPSSTQAHTGEAGADAARDARFYTGLSRREALALLTLLVVTEACADGSKPAGPDPTPPDPPTPPPVKPAGVRDLPITVELPAGTSLTASSLRVRSMGYPAQVTAAASVVAVSSPTYPTLAILETSTRRGVLAAMLDPSLSGAQTISARSTAVTLLWFALGGPLLRPEYKSQLLAQLGSDTAVTALAAVVSQRVAANPHAIVDGDPLIATALGEAISALTASVQSAFRDGATARGVHATANDAPAIFVTPEGAQSDVEVRLASTTAPVVTLHNSGRRNVEAFVYLVRTRTNGVTTDISPARLIGTPIPIGQPTAYTALSSIRAFLGAPTPFRGVPTAPVPLPLDGDSDESFYEIVVVGPSTRTPAPSFFAEARFAPHVSSWNAAIEQLFNRIYYGDIVYALALELSGLGSVIPDAPGLVLAGTTGAETMPHTTTGPAPRVPGTLQQNIAAIRTSMQQINTFDFAADSVYGQAPGLLDQVGTAALQQLGRVDWLATYRSAQDFILRLASPLDNYRPNGTLHKILDDLARVERGALWSARIARSRIRILPANAAVVAGEEVTLSVELSPDLTSSYEFEWTNASDTATLSAVGEVNSGRNITTRRTQVRLITDDDEAADIAIAVVAYDIAGGRRVRVSSDSIVVRLVPKVLITPDNAVLRVGDRQTFTVTLPFTPPAGTRYLWNLTGSAGSIGTLNLQTTTVPSIVYTAIRSGSDRLDVQVADSSDRLLAKGHTQVLVDPEEFVEITIAGLWDFQRTPAPGTYRYRDHRGARVPSPGGEGLDALFFGFNFAVDKPGVLITLLMPVGAPIVEGQVFSKNQEGQAFTAGQFALTMSVNQSDVENSQQRAILGSGTLRIDSIRRTSDNFWVAEYSFSAVGPSGGTVTGEGKNRWT